MNDEKGGFTVADRRHFDPDGTPRVTGPSPSGGEAGPTGETRRPTLADLLLSLAAQASMLLREPDAASEQRGLPPPDPEGARQLVALLEMLADKTEGRRTSDESRLLDDLLYQLRMTYLARTRGPA